MGIGQEEFLANNDGGDMRCKGEGSSNNKEEDDGQPDITSRLQLQIQHVDQQWEQRSCRKYFCYQVEYPPSMSELIAEKMRPGDDFNEFATCWQEMAA